MPGCRSIALVSLAVLAVASGSAVAASIDHSAVGCVVPDRFPRFEARVTPADAAARARVLFRAGGDHWYAVAMKREGDVLAAFLPKPHKTLQSFQYYIEVAGADLNTSRTEEHTAKVAAGGCGTMKNLSAAVATVLLEIPAGAASIPAGFASAGVVAATGQAAAAGAAGATAASGGGGLSTTALVVGGAGVVAAGGAVVATGVIGPPEKKVQIGGQVFANGTFFGNGGTNYMNPVAGAVVSTSLDSVTATTDGGGFFLLVTNTPKGVCPYTITIRAAGYPTYSVTGGWGDGFDDQKFILVPPTPSFVGPCQ